MHNITFYCEAFARPRKACFTARMHRNESGASIAKPQHKAQALAFFILTKHVGVTR